MNDAEDKLKIRTLIEEANDPKDRAILMVLANISDALSQQSETIVDVSSKLDLHLTRFEEQSREAERIINQGRGGIKAALWLLSIAQVVGIAFFTYAFQKFSDLQDFKSVSVTQHAVFENKLNTLEDRIVRHEHVEK